MVFKRKENAEYRNNKRVKWNRQSIIIIMKEEVRRKRSKNA